jgi:hypothetical protein
VRAAADFLPPGDGWPKHGFATAQPMDTRYHHTNMLCAGVAGTTNPPSGMSARPTTDPAEIASLVANQVAITRPSCLQLSLISAIGAMECTVADSLQWGRP